MEYSEVEPQQDLSHRILCCECGTPIQPNASNTCIGCLRARVDITEGIAKQVVIYFCKGCERYQQCAGQWVEAQLESRQLLALCLKKLKALSQVNLVDASFVWTEPHSRRLKVKLTVQKEVNGGAILQQVFVVEFVVNSSMCECCHRREAKDFWKALVQVRQKAAHKKTFFYLEQLLLKYRAHEKCVNVKPIHEGIDFFYNKKDDAKKLVDFLQTVIPCRYVTSQQLISHDTHNNTYNYKYTFAVEIAPVCKDDVVCLPPHTANQLGQMGQIAVVLRVTNQVTLIDPFSLKIADLSAKNYFRNPFRALCSCSQLAEYTVMDIETSHAPLANSRQSSKHVLADAYLVKSSEIGNSAPTHTRTHLGHLLHPGDLVLAFDLLNTNINEPNFERLAETNESKVPDVVVVKKYYGDKSARNRRRQWRLKHLDSQSLSDKNDLYDFLNDLEEDPLLRQNINIYRDSKRGDSHMAVDDDEPVDETCPQISLQEMLEDLTLE